MPARHGRNGVSLACCVQLWLVQWRPSRRVVPKRGQAGRQQQDHPANQKKPGGTENVRVEAFDAHDCGPTALNISSFERFFACQILVLLHDLARGIQTPQRCEPHIAECAVDLRHPAVNRSFDSVCHFPGDHIHDLSGNCCTCQDLYPPFFLVTRNSTGEGRVAALGCTTLPPPCPVALKVVIGWALVLCFLDSACVPRIVAAVST